MNVANRIALLLALLAILLASGCARLETRAALPPLPTPASDEAPAADDEHNIDAIADIWDRVRDGYALPDHDHRGTNAHLAWYARHQAYLNRVAERAEPYLFFVLEEIDRRDMPTEIALLPVVESAYHPFAYSHGRASGIWQFIPSTGRIFGMKQNWWYDGRRDIYASTHGALDYLENLQRRFDGDWLLALAAYNSGTGTVNRALRRAARRSLGQDFWSIRRYLPRETRGYVPKLLAISRLVDDPAGHGVTLRSIPNEPQIARVDFDSQIDLSLAAELAGISVDELYRLNPGFNRWATAPDGPHYLMLPIEKAGTFKYNLAQLPASERIGWKRHRIRSGESLLTIARANRTTVDLLKRVNNLRGNIIRAGDHLVIPVAKNDPSTYSLSADQRQRAIQNRARDGRKVVHMVRAGDTLWELARQHEVGVRELAKWNAMAPGDPLRAGQRLVIWSRASKTVTAVTADFRPRTRHAITRRVGYRVRQGDSLARISQRFKVSVQQLCRWNNLSADDYLQPGQRLTLYVDVTRQSS